MNNVPTHRNEQTGNPALDRMQANVRDAITSLRSLIATVKALSAVAPFLPGGKLVTITFAAGVAQTVKHGLGKPARGYIIVRSYGANVANAFGESGAAAPDPNNQIVLITTVNSKFDVWFYP